MKQVLSSVSPFQNGGYNRYLSNPVFPLTEVHERETQGCLAACYIR
jgi:hypothetical protein